MTRQTTWAGLSPEEHARHKIDNAEHRANRPEGTPPRYRLQVLDSHIDSRTGILYERAGFKDAAAAVTHARAYFPREYASGLYEVRPVITPL